MLASDITVCIITKSNYRKLNDCVLSIRKCFPSCKINIVDISDIPIPQYFPDGVHKYIVIETNASEFYSKGILIESVETNNMLFLSDEFVCNNKVDIRNLATEKVKLFKYRIANGNSLIQKYPIFNTYSFKNPNLNGLTMDPDLMTKKDSKPIPNNLLIPARRNRKRKRTYTNRNKIKEELKKSKPRKRNFKNSIIEKAKDLFVTNPESKGSKHKLVGKWRDNKTGFIYNIWPDGTSIFEGLPGGVRAKKHRWTQSADNTFNIINAEQSKFTVIFESDTEIIISPMGRYEFDYFNIGPKSIKRMFTKIEK
jgi:hypothetical protein